MPPPHLRKLRLLLEDTPGNHAIILFAQTELPRHTRPGHQRRPPQPHLLLRLSCDPSHPKTSKPSSCENSSAAVWPTAASTPPPLHLIATNCGGILRHAVNLTTAALIQTVRTQATTTTTAHVNTALMQPHWRQHDHWITGKKP